jgi:hypothetical protein
MNYLRNINNTIKQESPLLYWVVIIHILSMVLCIIGMTIDDRTLMGANVWIKPLKFSISGAIYIATVGYLITLYPYSRRKKIFINNTVAITMLIDLVIIVGQAARGVRSHYNIESPIDGILFGLMGLFVGVNVLIMLLFIIDTIRKKLDTSKAIQLSILLGWIVVFFGSWIGGQMISQMAHNVGVADGGAGLPLVNWSTIAGDLRVGHFFGLHGIQIIPLFAFMLSKKWKASDTKQIIAVAIFGLLYASWIGYTFYQAKQGMPFIKM